MINGSPRTNGNIAVAFEEMTGVFEKEGIEVELYQIGKKDIRGCIACETCRKTGKCVFDDIVNELAVKFKEADGLVIGSPVYYGSANGTLMSALQRLFYSTHFDKSFKVGASVVSARRSGCTATFAGTKPDGNVYSTTGTLRRRVSSTTISVTGQASAIRKRLKACAVPPTPITPCIRPSFSRKLFTFSAMSSPSNQV